jgi:SAM-dependent methyltransferase
MAFLTKHKVYKILSPVLKQAIPASQTKKMLTKILRRHNISYLEIGGAVAVSGYVVIHLSPVEVYGIPRIRNKGVQYKYNSVTGDFDKELKDLKDACTLNYDLMNGIPIEDNSLDGINMSHFLEHFTRDDGLFILKECLRVLKPGSVLRISCPDLKKYAEAYVQGNDEYFRHPLVSKFVNYKGLSARGDLFIHKAYDGSNGHKWFYDANSAIQLALDAGFKKGVSKKLHESNLPSIEIIEPAYREAESFYVEVYN